MSTEPLDSSTHEEFLEKISKTLNAILKEITELRKDIERLPSEMDRGG
jgi:hypothetical protein